MNGAAWKRTRTHSLPSLLSHNTSPRQTRYVVGRVGDGVRAVARTRIQYNHIVRSFLTSLLLDNC
jgi:hypothetical protein